MRTPDISKLKKFVPGLKAFLSAPRTVSEILTAVGGGRVWRRAYAVDGSFAAATKEAFPWCKTRRTKLLLFLRSAGFWVAGESVLLRKPIPDATQAIKGCGTPVRILVAYYERLDVRLVLMNGARCSQVWEPADWTDRPKRPNHRPLERVE